MNGVRDPETRAISTEFGRYRVVVIIHYSISDLRENNHVLYETLVQCCSGPKRYFSQPHTTNVREKKTNIESNPAGI